MTMFRILTIIPILIMFMAVSGCGKSPDKSPVLASIGGINITVSDFNERVSNLPARYREIIKKRKKEFLEELINDTLLYQEAVRKDLHKDEDVKKVIKEARKKILIARLLKDEVDDAINITDDDIAKFYEENKTRYMTPEIMRVSHILVPTRDEAEVILSKLNSGASFDEVARSKSVDPTAQRGGDIGYFPKGQLMPEFENACSTLAVNETSGIVKTKLGYHIIMLTDRREPKERPLEQVRDDMKSRIRKVKRQKIFNDLLGRLRKEITVDVNEEALSGAYSSQTETEKIGGNR